MRFLYVKLTGYIGLYNGLGLNEIELHLDRCKNNITVISGPNGVGKSTIINALNILPDPNTCFVPTMIASKIIKLQDKDNIYDIIITHPLDRSNNRGTTKATIQKNGMELNPNGNISSYKEIIFTEFDMDSNYLELSKISGNNRGLGDKKPAERKKIMSSLISSLDVYNNIYKNLNKKANIFKSYITNLSSKIKNVGDESVLRSTLSALISKEQRLQDTIDKSKEMITEAKTIITMQDPDGSMKSKYDSIINELKRVESECNQLYLQLSSLGTEINIDEVKESILKNMVSIENSKVILQGLNESSKEILNNINSINEEISRLEVKINKLKGECNTEISDNIEQFRNEISTIEKSFKVLGIDDISDISKDEIDHTINTITNIVDMIDRLYSSMSTSHHESIKKYYKIDLNREIREADIRVTEIDSEIEKLQRRLIEVKSDLRTTSVLNNRPEKCKIDSCPFISNALEIKQKYFKPIEKEEEEIIISIEEYKKEKEKILFSKSYNEDMKDILSYLGTIIELIKSNRKLLSKFSVTTQILNESSFLELISNRHNFVELRSLSQYMDISNSIVEYKSRKKVLQTLEAEYVIYQNNIKLISEFEKELNILIKNKEIYSEKYKETEIYIETEKKLLSSIEATVQKQNEIISIYGSWESKSEERNKLKKESEDLNNQFDSTLVQLQKITELQELININIEELKPIINEKKNIESQLTLLDSYQSEYLMYKEKFDYVDKLRKYSSPTSGSIQSLFMSIYMDKTLSMVNQLLGMMFNGQYRILQYIINEDEFRIPFVGNGLTVDDISSGSTSQVCIMGMIINLVLAHISAGRYNIISLDEIDGGLDHVNRYMFVEVLQKICSILEIEQLFIISHSVESALNNVDVILLSNSDEYKDQFANTNIIYQFGGK